MTIQDRLLNQPNGACKHTSNKAAYYIDYLGEDEKRVHIKSELIELSEKALQTNDWKELRQFMEKWW